MSPEDFRKNIASRISDEEIKALKGYVAGAQDWGAPSTNDLVALAELHNLIIMRGFASDKPARFDLLDVAEMIGLTLHEMTHYVDIGNWISMDRRYCKMGEDEIEEFFSSMDELLTSMEQDEEIGEMFTTTLASTVERVDEIAELNNLFYEE